MIDPRVFLDRLAERGVDFVTGVPDSLMAGFCAHVASLPAERHVIAVNEGTAIALAAGNHLATGGVPLVYLQNSGLGNAVNPLLSLADPEVYALPMILLVGWRGAPGEKDEPQHLKQGRVTPALLEAMEIPCRLLDGDMEAAADWAARTARSRGGPVVLLARKGTFHRPEAVGATEDAPPRLSREAAIAAILRGLPAGALVVATTGMASRELHELRKARGENGASDFLTVGSMGHASQVALGIARAAPGRRVVCLDGDGAALMHMGGLATIGARGSGDLLHVLLNNGAHDSVGGQPTVGFEVSFTGIARACGYEAMAGPVETEADIAAQLSAFSGRGGRRFLEIRVRRGSRADLGRPAEGPAANKARFVAMLRG